MNRKYLLPAIATVLIVSMLLSSTQIAFATTLSAVIGPKLVVTTIPEDDQVHSTGIIILGLTPSNLGGSPWTKPFSKCTAEPGGSVPTICKDVSSHKLLVTYNGQPIFWRLNTNDPVPRVTCNVLEKDKVQPLADKLGNGGPQFTEENLLTQPVDVSSQFVCKARWKEIAPAWFESAGVLDVYYVGPASANFIADNILTVETFLTVGKVTIVGTDIQDICILGWSMGANHFQVTLPDARGTYNTWDNPLGPFVSCEDAALWQRSDQGVPIASTNQG